MKAFIATAQVKKKNHMNVSEVPLCATFVLFSLSRSHSHLLYNYYLKFLFLKIFIIWEIYTCIECILTIPISHYSSLTPPGLLFFIPFFHTHVGLFFL